MKTPKLLFAAALAALAFVHAASAQTNIYLSGAPATRAIWNTAIYDELGVLTGGTSSLVKYWTGTNGYAKANQIVITGGTISGTPVTIYGSWTGSTGGDQSVANTPPETIAALQVGFINLSGAPITGGTVGLTNNLQYPQVNLSDTWQSTIPFHGSVTITSPHTSYVTLTEATTASPAITGYKFVANNGSPARLNNITTNLAQQLFTSAGTPLAFFTGSNADEGAIIYPVGRDIGSGARYVLLAETGIGTAHSNSLVQFEPAVTSGTITDIVDHPATSGTINLIAPIVGNGGYPSFSAVQTVLAASSSNASVGYIVTYVTDSDAITAETAGAHELSWNGVYYGTAYEGTNNTAPVSIAEGQYTFWSYLHVYYNNTGNFIQTNHPLAKTFADGLSYKLSVDTNTGAILTSDLNVSRNSDGGEVTQTY